MQKITDGNDISLHRCFEMKKLKKFKLKIFLIYILMKPFNMA